MSEEVRLDPDTLEWVAEWSMTRLGIYGVAENAAALRAMAEEARSRPPGLADWVLAVEGVCDVSWDTRGEYLCGYLDGHYVSIYSSGSEGADLDDQHFDDHMKLREALKALYGGKHTGGA